MTTLLSTLEHRIVAGFMLVAALLFSFPEVILAAGPALPEHQGLVFELKQNVNINAPVQTQVPALSYQELGDNDPLVVKVREYLEERNSPLAVHTKEIVQQSNWKRALAISFVESNFGKYCFDNNCSGIGVKPGHPSWRKYETKLDWFIDLNELLERPLYQTKANTCKKMRGIYVVPGSDRWVNGCNKVVNDLTELSTQADQDRIVLAQNHSKLALTNINLTFPSLVN